MALKSDLLVASIGVEGDDEKSASSSAALSEVNSLRYRGISPC
jgi:hypothetical protein